MRTIIIGDIHGCYRELTKLLEKVEFNKKEDRLISLGDLMDRGEQSYEVFDLFRQLKAEMGERCIIIRGNHEDMMMNSTLWSGAALWKSNGGNKTIRSFYKHKTYVHHHVAWFKKNTVLTYEEENFQCCHAGLDSEEIAGNLPEVLMWDRTRIDQNDYYGKLTIIGHTPVENAAWCAGDKKTIKVLPERKWMKLPETGLICLDTGCVFGYKLSAMVIDGTEYRLDSVSWSRDDSPSE